MEIKICSQCNLEKNIDEFYYFKKANKYQNKCKECVKKYSREYQKNNKEKIKEHKKEYFKKYRKENIEYIKEKNKKYRETHKEENKIYAKKYRENNKEYFKEYQKEYNKKKKIEKAKSKTKGINKIKQKELRNFKQQVRCLISKSFSRKKFGKDGRTEEILGCSFEELYNHLLNTYKNNYNVEWNKKEKVHIDHIIPLKIAKTKEEVIKLCHYKNLQLLKAQDNLCKSGSLNWGLLK